ncbi:MAG: type II toxin-antitoxin system mRNA interferase toxin, RelE/StbE family [Candidatus Magnetominusculus sp. LBB02]|nr:type II toxin-antitoxin system mRNA interferase toxin, RelE/StbE family [Candidatus Magnetominusculus sp. LBB02]
MTIKADKPFIKKVSKYFKKDQALKKEYLDCVSKIIKNPFDPSLKTHKLTGNLKDRYACSLTHDIRITFTLSGDTLYLLNIGSHDEVY